MNPSVDVILERLSRIDCEARVCFRPDFYRFNKEHPHRWYLNMGRVVMTSSANPGKGELELTLNAGCSNIVFGHSGSSPEEAVRNGWAQILQDMKRPTVWFVRMHGKPGRHVMDSERMMWFRWNESLDDWESPPPSMLKSVPENRIESYHPNYPDRNYL